MRSESESESEARSLASRTTRCCAARVGIFGMLAGMVRQTGSVRVVGDGSNHWPAVHVESLGPFADALALDQTVTGQHARQVLAWELHGPGLIADLSAQRHFQQSNGA